jgi:carbonic anhydrase/acetyltransferase-like protein (isoleucine patch superfamily)
VNFGPGVVLQDPAYIHPGAQIYGRVRIEQGASVWCFVAMRAETHEIVIGPYTNIQDFVMIHVGTSTPTIVGSHCSITHHCTLHGCTIGDNCLIGLNVTIMDGAVVGKNCIVAGHSFLKEDTVVPDNSIVVGTPGKVVRTHNNYVANRLNAFLYYRNALAYRQGRHREWASAEGIGAIAAELKRLNTEFAELGQNKNLSA